MQEYNRTVYEDPTGGGEDLVLVYPVWFTPPETVGGKYQDGSHVTFEIDGDSNAPVDEDIAEELLERDY